MDKTKEWNAVQKTLDSLKMDLNANNGWEITVGTNSIVIKSGLDEYLTIGHDHKEWIKII